jgi:hypothetical protein
VASLPCYSLDNVDKQRGCGVFDKSIAALQKLNALGYGREGSGLTLNLVYNPQGAMLPPDQGKLHTNASCSTSIGEVRLLVKRSVCIVELNVLTSGEWGSEYARRRLPLWRSRRGGICDAARLRC